MSSISRRRNGLMACRSLGAPVLGAVFSPSISRQDACFCYSPRPFPCYKLPRERFSASAHPRRCRTPRRRSLCYAICRPSSWWIGGRGLCLGEPPESRLDGGEGNAKFAGDG